MIRTKRTKKVISWLLALAMVLTILPMSAFAATTENNIINLTPDDLVEGASGEGWVFSNNRLTIQPEYTLVFEGECPVYVVNNGNIENGIFNGEVFSEGTISGGTFSSKVTNDGTITGGTFSDTVANNTVYAVISNGIFNGEAHNFGTISGGTFSGKLVNYWDRSISGITIELSNALIEGGESYGWSLDEYNNLNLNSDITFYWKAGETCGYPVDNEGTITGGIFNSEVHNSGTISGGTFNSSWGTNFGTITGGTFSGGLIKNESSGTITGGTFNGEVHNSGGDISGGTFSGKLRKNSGSISGITIELSNALIEGGESYGWSLDVDNLILNSDITFYWKAGEECAYNVRNSGTISGGTFNWDVYNSGTITGGTFINRTTNDGTITGGTFSLNVSNKGTITGGKFTGGLNGGGIVTGTADLSELTSLDIRYGPRFGKDVKLPKAVMQGNLTYTGCEASTRITLEYYADGDCTSTHTVSGSSYSFAVEGYKRTDPEADLSTLEEITHEVKAASMDGYDITVTKANWDRFNITVAHTTPELIITGGTADTDYTYENGVLDITTAGTYEIKNVDPDTATDDTIKVSASSGMVNITLSGVVINVSSTGGSGTNALAAFEITGNCNTVLILKDGCENVFDSGLNRAGIANHSHALTIACEHSEISAHECSTGCGYLRAVGQSSGAGIGGDANEAGANITIKGGNIVAAMVGSERGAGIGGGLGGNGNNITISGGIVTATSEDGAGIGGGDGGSGSDITISGGIITATGNDAGIGGDDQGSCSNVTISGGVVTATSTHGGGIGHGANGGTAENIKIAPAANMNIYAYNGSDNTGDALNGSPFTAETDITGRLSGNAFYSYAEHTHNYTYTANENVITEACSCGHSETATITAPQNPVYDGTPKAAFVGYSAEWQGGELAVTYSEGGNINAGSVMASIEKDGAAARVTFEIAQATPTAVDGSETKASSIRKNNKLSASTITGGKYKGIDDAELEGTYDWKEPDKDMTADSKEIVVFTPNNTNYAPVEIEVDVNVTSSSSSGGGGVSRHTIKFETNGGTEIAYKTVTRNSKLAEPTAPTKDGYTFNGWYTDKEFKEEYDFDKPVTKSFTLYAKWEKHDDEEPVTPEWENPFTDVTADDWFYADVRYVNENSLMNGTSETTFAPNNNLTRAMLVTVLYRLEGEPEMKNAQWFEDVEKGQWYSDAVSWATFNGITMGYGDGNFGPDDYITREQIAAIMHRYAQYKGIDVSVGENTNILSYDDFADISEYAIAAMQYACGSGLMKGKSESTLNPKDFATRAEIAAILHRFIETNK